ncbi:MAG: TolC family protein [Bacteroidales bacterium]|nr:TolC family protein [Bacteroidales bacterium]
MKKRSFVKHVAILILFAVFCIGQFSVFGQIASKHLTLNEAIEISKTQSPDAFNAKQAFRSSYWEFRSYKASNLPSLLLTSTLPEISQSLSPYLKQDGTQTYISSKELNANAGLALRQNIGVTGGNISLRSSLNYYSNNELPFYGNPLNLNFNQPIFSFNPYRWDRKIKPLTYSLAKRKYIEDIEQICITTTNHFFTLLQAQIEKKIALTNKSNYDTLYSIAKGRYQLGKIAENDLLQLELNFLKAQAAVENADLALDNAQFKFKSYLRLQDSMHVVLLPPGNIDFFKIDPRNAVTLANENSSVVLEFKKRLLEAARAVNQARLDGRFDAEVNASVGLQQSGYTVPDTYLNLLDQRRVSLGITIPILDWGVARGQIKIAQSQEEIVKNSVEQDIIDFQRNVYLKAVEFNMQQNQVKIAAKSDTVARKSYEVTKGRYLIGKINSILDLNNAQIETDNSEKNYYFTLQTFWKSYYEIRKMTLFDFLKNEPLPFDLRDFK